MILYHATFRTNLASIKELGLGAKQHKNYDFSLTGVIYLTNNSDVAYSFCESSDEVSDYKMNSGIIVLAVDTRRLDPKYSGIDENMINNNDGVNYYTYSNIIKPELLSVVTSKKGNIGKLLGLKRVPAYE